MAARWNSSAAPHGPRNRSRPRPRMRLRCAKQHLDLLSKFSRDLVFFRLSDVPGHLTGAFVDRSQDLAGRLLRAALRLQWAGIAIPPCWRGSASCRFDRPAGVGSCRSFGAVSEPFRRGRYRRRPGDRSRSPCARRCRPSASTCRIPECAARSRGPRQASPASARTRRRCRR